MKFQVFNKPFGQIEVGGKFAGLAFHNGAALPSRMSFYYPVANSISNSKDYWKRYESQLFAAILTIDGQAQTIGYDEHQTEYTPYCFRATKHYPNSSCRYEYSFGNDLPITVIRIELTNTGAAPAQYVLDLTPETALHSCHSFNKFHPEKLTFAQGCALLIADFSDIVDLGNCSLFFINTGMLPQHQPAFESAAGFQYAKLLAPGAALNITLIAGCCKTAELPEMVQRVQRDWSADSAANSERVDDYIATRGNIAISDPALTETIDWSKAVHASLQHYLDGWYLPMPCPAEYNFFFTHDFLVHGLGWGYFDLDYLQNGYKYLLSLNTGDNVLSHACYWKDNAYYSEPCPPTDWNNLWIVNSVSSYLKHSNDTLTARQLLPMLQTSLDRILLNFDDGLMKAYFPDWWDFGTNYGARAYISILTYRAIHNFTYITTKLSHPELAAKYYPLAEIIRRKLNEQLWDEQSGYLLNELADGSIDNHYYSGSLLAPNFGLLDANRANRLLDTAQKELLDGNCGVHNVAPADFVGLEEKYGFHNVEQGENGYYINGGVWTQCNAWYALSLITQNRVEEAYSVLKNHLALAGIKNSHNGQPSFYEARITAIDENYGKIDKPTFLWHGGWFMLTLYQLLGIRETPWNIELNPITASELITSTSEIKNHGNNCVIEFSGCGDYFQEIAFDGQVSYSAILTESCRKARLMRGTPTLPYLAASSCIIESVAYNPSTGELAIAATLAPHQQLDVTIILPANCSLSASCPELLITAQSANTSAKTFTIRSKQASIILLVK